MADSSGLMGSIKQLTNTLLVIVQTRLELLSTEIEAEKLRIERRLFYGSICLLFFGLFMIFVTTLILVLLWEEYRFQVLAGFSAIYLIAGVISLEKFRRVHKPESRLFSTSLNELRIDRERLELPNE